MSADARLTALRHAFDHGFALPPPAAADELEDLIAIRVGGHPYALRLAEVAEILSRQKIVPVPTATRDLLGLVGVRGCLVPVFALATILGYPQAESAARWLMLCRAGGGADGAQIALACGDFDGHLRLPRARVHAGDSARAAREYIQLVASTDGGPRPVISVPLITRALDRRVGDRRPAKEG